MESSYFTSTITLALSARSNLDSDVTALIASSSKRSENVARYNMKVCRFFAFVGACLLLANISAASTPALKNGKTVLGTTTSKASLNSTLTETKGKPCSKALSWVVICVKLRIPFNGRADFLIFYYFFLYFQGVAAAIASNVASKHGATSSKATNLELTKWTSNEKQPYALKHSGPALYKSGTLDLVTPGNPFGKKARKLFL